jgi:hypothetical protein
MAEHTRPLAEVTKLILDTSVMLSQRASELLQRVIDDLPPDEEPAPLTIDASQDTTDATGMTVLLAWDNSGTGNHVTIDWGATDTVDDDEPATGTMSYQYATAGTYEITVTDLEDDARYATVDVTVPFVTGGDELIVTATENTTDTTRMTVDVTVDNGTFGTATIDFGNDSPIAANPGDGTTVTTRLYATAGTYVVTATDTDDATRTATASVTVPFTG